MSVKKLYRKVSLLVKKTENKRVRYIFLISFFIVMSFIFLWVGHFLFGSGEEGNPIPPMTTQQLDHAGSTEIPQGNPVKHIHRSGAVNGVKQEIHILEIDPGAPGVRIQPVLSRDLIYGFEKLSEMAARKKAYAAVNSGFFHEYGLPAGMVVIDGEFISASTGRYPVFVVENGKAALKQIDSKLTVEYESGGTVGSIPIDSLNFPAGEKETSVYTPVYGLYNRAEKKNITATVENGVVTKVAFLTGEAEIPKNGMLISFFDTGRYAGIEMPFKVGDAVSLSHQPVLDRNADAYECGSWLVRDSKSVVALKDAWVGIMTNRDPRTAIGIREDGTVILLTVDGRQPGYSAGFTGKELAEYLISYGVKEAAMLDGGASTEMIVDGKLVSRPSYKGEERPLGGGMLVLLEKKYGT